MENEHRNHIHLISANSCNIVRVICEIPLHFYAYFHNSSYPSPISYAIPVANLKSTYTMCLCREMGLPLDKLLVSCKPGSAAEQFFKRGEYQIRPSEEKGETLFIHGNLERYDNDNDNFHVSTFMIA